MVVGAAPEILLVDDEEDFVLTLAERLETRGMSSVVVHSGEAALARFAASIPAVMVLDLNMPGMKGLEVLRRVKAMGAPTQVIILTGHGSEQERRRANEIGAFAYLNKPVHIDVLADTMRRAFAKLDSDVLERRARGEALA